MYTPGSSANRLDVSGVDDEVTGGLSVGAEAGDPGGIAGMAIDDDEHYILPLEVLIRKSLTSGQSFGQF